MSIHAFKNPPWFRACIVCKIQGEACLQPVLTNLALSSLVSFNFLISYDCQLNFKPSWYSTDLLYRRLDNISSDKHGVFLAEAKGTGDRLVFNRWVPLRLDDEHSICDSEVQAIEVSV